MARYHLPFVRRLIGFERRLTVVFDRGGFRTKLFRQIIDDGFALLTYRKGRVRRVPKKRFNAVTAKPRRTMREALSSPGGARE